MAVPYSKPPLSFKEQLDLLVSRGLDVPDRPAAEAALENISYYRFSAYCLAFKNEKDCFHAGTTWNDVLDLYQFDRKLRILVLDALERIEIAVRTTTTYTLAHSYGAFCHHDPANFRSGFQHQQWQEKCRVEIQKSHETFIQHFKMKYEGFPRLPIRM